MNLKYDNNFIPVKKEELKEKKHIKELPNITYMSKPINGENKNQWTFPGTKGENGEYYVRISEAIDKDGRVKSYFIKVTEEDFEEKIEKIEKEEEALEIRRLKLDGIANKEVYFLQENKEFTPTGKSLEKFEDEKEIYVYVGELDGKHYAVAKKESEKYPENHKELVEFKKGIIDDRNNSIYQTVQFTGEYKKTNMTLGEFHKQKEQQEKQKVTH